MDLSDSGIKPMRWQLDFLPLSHLGSHTDIIQEFNGLLWTWFIDCAVYKNIGNLISHNYFILCIEIICFFSPSFWRQIMKQLFHRKTITIFHKCLHADLACFSVPYFLPFQVEMNPDFQYPKDYFVMWYGNMLLFMISEIFWWFTFIYFHCLCP